VEFWTVVRADGTPVPPIDENNHEDQGMMVYRSKAAAGAMAYCQRQRYDMRGVKPRRLDQLDIKVAKPAQ